MKSAAILVRQAVGAAFRVIVAACLAGMVFLPAAPAAAQEQMFLESANLVYDYDANLISAVGNVTVRYRGYVLTTDRLTYYQSTGRLVAVGNVRLVDADGTIYTAGQLDITDDFRAGFIEQLFVVTAERTYFSADSARRSDGRITEFLNGEYTACEVVAPNDRVRPPLWNVSAARIIHDEEEEMIYFERARLEVFGVPVAFLPRLATPDPSVTRATGFLFPEFSLSSQRGLGIGIPYFWAPAPNYDLTITPTYFTRAGLLLNTEWRHQLQRGIYTIETAGIYETSPGPSTFRGGVRTTGAFDLSRFWSFGWDGQLQTDRHVAQKYEVLNTAPDFVTSRVWLTGVNDTAYINAQGYHFLDVRGLSPRTEQVRQATVHPTIDHDFFLGPVLGGEARVTGNLTVLSREAEDPFMVGPDTYYYGLAGRYLRLSEDVSWRREFVTGRGQVITPFAFTHGDFYLLDLDAPPAGVTTDQIAARAVAGVGIQWSWPFLISSARGTHVLEPIVQLVARTGEQMIGALPNDDAQSLVFDTTNVLPWDRFTGDDRTEGGTRLTLAFRYSGQFALGTIDAMVGQSFHLYGPSSYAIPDIRNTVFGSGLESPRSDLVASVRGTGTRGNSIAMAGRFDSGTFALQQGTLSANFVAGPVQTSTGIAYDRSRLDLEGTPESALRLTSSASIALTQHWTLTGGLTYDFITGTVLNDYIGIAYNCDCATMSVTLSESRSPGSPDVNRSVMFGLQLRTLGDYSFSPRR